MPPLPDDVANATPKAAGLNVDEEGPGQVEVSLAHGASMLVNALGPPPPEVIATAHEHGVLVGGLVGSRQHAERQVAMGVDVIVAQGTEAGGHCGEISTMVIVPEVVDAVGPDVPVLAAGGIGCGRQMAAAMALGAQGVWTGSIWLTVAEADTQPIVVEKFLEASSRDTVRSRAMTGKPARQLRSGWTDAWAREDTPEPLPMPLQGLLFNSAGRRITRSQNRELAGLPRRSDRRTDELGATGTRRDLRHGAGVDRDDRADVGAHHRRHAGVVSPTEALARPGPPRDLRVHRRSCPRARGARASTSASCAPSTPRSPVPGSSPSGSSSATGRSRCSEVARRLQVDQSTASRHVRPLEELASAHRAPADAADRRVAWLRVTPTGQRLLDGARRRRARTTSTSRSATGPPTIATGSPTCWTGFGRTS